MMHRAQPVLRREGDLHRRPRADVLDGCAGRPACPASQGAVMNDLTNKEQKAVRTALRFLRLRVGAWEPLAKALRHKWDSIQKVATGKRAVTLALALALRVTRFAGVPVDELLTGWWLSPRVCPQCGHPPDDFTDEETVVDRGRREVGDRGRASSRRARREPARSTAGRHVGLLPPRTRRRARRAARHGGERRAADRRASAGDSASLPRAPHRSVRRTGRQRDRDARRGDGYTSR
jgi:hypothetical protein